MSEDIIHRKDGDKNPVKRKFNVVSFVIFIMQIVFFLVLTVFIVKLNIVPFKYLIVGLLVLFIINILSIFLINRRKKILKFIGYLLTTFILFVNMTGLYYINETNNFLNKAFGNADEYDTNSYYLLVLNNDQYNKVEDLIYEKIGYYDNIPNIDEALSSLNKEYEFESILYDDSEDMIMALEKREVSAIIFEQSYYNFLVEYDDDFNKNSYKIIYDFDVQTKRVSEKIDNSDDAFSIYIGGADFTNLYNDFNMIVTINKKTHKILLTSTPRDFYVNIHGKNGKDLLGYAAPWGIDTSRKTLEDLYGINIDYYIKINTESLVGLVDTLGGVEFCSDIAYTTTHATVMGTYNDTKGRKLYVKKGCYNYSGIQILTIARERKAYYDGDRQRQKNCQAIMISIFNKLVSADTIVNYSSILNSVSNLYTTNISKDLVTDFAKDVINNGSKWTFERQSVTGYDSRGNVHFSKHIDYVMIPDNNSVAAATAKIKEIENQ